MAVILDGRVIRKFFREGIGKRMGFISVWTEGISGLAGAERHHQSRWEDRVFCLTVDKACFCLHKYWCLHGYGEEVDWSWNKRGGYQTLRVQHNSLKVLV